MATVFFNGSFIDTAHASDAAQVSVFDAGFQHAVGLFETFTAFFDQKNGSVRVPHLESHLARLAQSASELQLSTDINTEALAEAVTQTVVRATLPRARVRLTITGGDLNLLRAASTQSTDTSASTAQQKHTPTIMIVCQPATEYPQTMFDNGVAVSIAATRTNPLNRFESHKALNYWWRLSELQAAAAHGSAESIVFQVSNHLAGGCVSNVFVVKDGVLCTPIARGEEELVAGSAGADPSSTGERSGASVPSPVLPGITRGRVIDAARDKGITVRRRMLTINELLDADEVFLTNASWCVLPVVRVEQKQINSGAPGNMTRLLHEACID